MRKIIKKNPLYFAFLFPALTDGIITIVGQGRQYWESGVVNEASPAYYVLLVSPYLFIAGSIIWYVSWYFIFKRLKEPLNLFLMFLFIAGHSWGSTSWIWHIAKEKGLCSAQDQISVILVWALVVGYFALIAIFATYSFRIYLHSLKVKK
jgi:hypothetical protein